MTWKNRHGFGAGFNKKPLKGVLGYPGRRWVKMTCPKCGGAGGWRRKRSWKRCPKCDGTGWIIRGMIR